MTDAAPSAQTQSVEPTRSRRAFWINLGLALVLGGECVWAIYGSEDLADVAWWLLVSSFLIVNTMRRAPAAETDNRWWVWLACTASFLHFLAFEHSPDTRWAYLALLLLMLAADANLVYLGRSFSILPARREIRTGLMYRFVRHPVYASYALLDLLYVAFVPTWRNGVVVTGSLVLLAARADLEERLLRHDPEYVDYAERVRFRFLPGIY